MFSLHIKIFSRIVLQTYPRFLGKNSLIDLIDFYNFPYIIKPIYGKGEREYLKFAYLLLTEFQKQLVNYNFLVARLEIKISFPPSFFAEKTGKPHVKSCTDIYCQSLQLPNLLYTSEYLLPYSKYVLHLLHLSNKTKNKITIQFLHCSVTLLGFFSLVNVYQIYKRGASLQGAKRLPFQLQTKKNQSYQMPTHFLRRRAHTHSSTDTPSVFRARKYSFGAGASHKRPTFSTNSAHDGRRVPSFRNRVMNVIANKCNLRFKRESSNETKPSQGHGTQPMKPFVNDGLNRWEQARQQWLTPLSNYVPKPKQAASVDQRAADVTHVYQSLVNPNYHPLPRKIPLAEFVDVLQDVRDRTG